MGMQERACAVLVQAGPPGLAPWAYVLRVEVGHSTCTLVLYAPVHERACKQTEPMSCCMHELLLPLMKPAVEEPVPWSACHLDYSVVQGTPAAAAGPGRRTAPKQVQASRLSHYRPVSLHPASATLPSIAQAQQDR